MKPTASLVVIRVKHISTFPLDGVGLNCVPTLCWLSYRGRYELARCTQNEPTSRLIYHMKMKKNISVCYSIINYDEGFSAPVAEWFPYVSY